MQQCFVTILFLSTALLSPITTVRFPAVLSLPPDNKIEANGNSHAVPSLPPDNIIPGEQDRQTRQQAYGYYLRYDKPYSVIVWNPCNNQEAIYMGLTGVFHTTAVFEDKLSPLSNPGWLDGLVTSAAFINTAGGSHYIFVIDGWAWLRLYGQWFPCQGVTNTVSHVTTEQCCLSVDSHCQSISGAVVLYQRGVSDKQVIFFSTNWGLRFTPVAPGLPYIASKGIVGAIYIMGMSLKIVMAVVEIGDYTLGRPDRFHFQSMSDSSEMSDKYAMMDTVDYIEVIQPVGMRGHVIIWTPRMLLYSPNNGFACLPVYEVGKGRDKILPANGDYIKSLTTGANGVIAFILSDASLYYGRLGLEATVIKFETSMLTLGFSFERGMLLAFNEYGDLELVTPSQVDPTTWSFEKKSLGVEQQLTELWADGDVIPCPVVQFFGDFNGKFYYMDIGGSVRLTVVYIPIPQCPFFPVVTLTNGEALNAKVELVVDGITTVGNKKFKMEILINQKLAETGFIQDLYIALVNVDLMERGVACSKLNPQKAHIVVACPPEKHIRVSRDMTTCTQGILSQAQLRNFTYNISKEVYDPEFLARPNAATSDLTIQYDYFELLCPLLVYHDMPWMPRFELWEDDTFVEYVKADFVLREIHGMHNYQYLQTAKKAKCVSQPQDWISMLMSGNVWNRKNYKSCKDLNGPPLTNLDAPYQVLNQESKNRIGFSNYNGMYIFEATVLDPAYSYCSLQTRFSVYVYGAFPKRILPPGVFTGIFIAIFFGLLIIVFFILRQSGYKKFSPLEFRSS